MKAKRAPRTALSKRGSKYTDIDRRQAVGIYVVTGSYVATAKQMNIPDRTVNEWSKSEWWLSLIEQVRHEKQDELDAQITGAIHKAFKKVDDRLEQGDPYIQKDGQIGYKPVTARDSAMVGGIMYDKRSLIRNMPTTITSTTGSDKLLKLLNNFEEIAHKKTLEIEASIVSEG